MRALNEVIDKALKDEDFRQQLNGMGLEPLGGSVEEFQAFVDTEVDKYRELIQAAGIEPM